jgi:hypothetical protein
MGRKHRRQRRGRYGRVDRQQRKQRWNDMANGPEFRGQITTTVEKLDGTTDVHEDLGFQLEVNNNLLYVVDVEEGSVHAEHQLTSLKSVKVDFTQ